MARITPKLPGPDPSQRPRREAPGMLTGFAILERELGINDYTRHRLERRLRHKLTAAEAAEVRRQMEELEQRRIVTLRLLDQKHAEYDERFGHDPRNAAA